MKILTCDGRELLANKLDVSSKQNLAHFVNLLSKHAYTQLSGYDMGCPLEKPVRLPQVVDTVSGCSVGFWAIDDDIIYAALTSGDRTAYPVYSAEVVITSLGVECVFVELCED